jgi:isopropylmalate/homocitrate/citramalate synthase
METKKTICILMIYFPNVWQKTQIRFRKTSGKANIEKNLQELGLKLNAEDLKLVTQRIIELEIKKKPLLGKTYPISSLMF